MDSMIVFLNQFGLWGLSIISFTESFISPIIPDLLLIPMALANPDKAIFYSLIVTLFSVLGGFIGYWIGYRYGQPLFDKKVPPKYGIKIKFFFDKYGYWAVFLASLFPIPYKFVSISSGVFRINWFVFVLLSILGRAKRFLIVGILIKYYGNQAVSLISQYSDDFLIVLTLAMIAVVLLKRFLHTKKVSKEELNMP